MQFPNLSAQNNPRWFDIPLETNPSAFNYVMFLQISICCATVMCIQKLEHFFFRFKNFHTHTILFLGYEIF